MFFFGNMTKMLCQEWWMVRHCQTMRLCIWLPTNRLFCGVSLARNKYSVNNRLSYIILKCTNSYLLTTKWGQYIGNSKRQRTYNYRHRMSRQKWCLAVYSYTMYACVIFVKSLVYTMVRIFNFKCNRF